MNWITEKPTKTGYYWAYSKRKKELLLIEIDKDTYGMPEIRPPYCNIMGNECGRRMDYFSYFMGPLDKPKTPRFIEFGNQTAACLDGKTFVVRNKTEDNLGNIGCDQQGDRILI